MSKFIKIDEKLPNHKTELNCTKEKIEKIKKIIKKIKLDDSRINPTIYLTLYTNIVTTLNYVGKLSIPFFNIEENLEKKYDLKYKQTPNIGNKLFLNHYEKIHKPYSTLKNRCYYLLETLNDVYLRKFDKLPPTM